MKLKYIPEIDGLRTIAVLSVIFYHAQISINEWIFLKGGFLGVDIFFVISGFIITTVILHEKSSKGSFSIADFYERRVRRLFPALLTVMTVSIPFAWKFLLPSQLVDFSKSLVASIIFGSNIYWYIALQEYGVESALLKPFLHTWSLAVEEQFYIIYPLLFLVLFRFKKKYLITLTVLCILVSLLLAEFVTTRNGSFSFYMLPTRFWELLIGGVIASYMFFSPRKNAILLHDRIMSILGMLLIVLSILLFGKETHHPGIITIIPVVGTVLIIYFANKEIMITKFLSSKVMTTIGLLSYSLYIWHYPIFAFGRIIFYEFTIYHKLTAILLTGLFSSVSYILIERPCRQRSMISKKIIFSSLLVVMTTLTTFSAYSIQNDGLSNRFSMLAKIYGQNQFDNQILKREGWRILNNLASQEGLGPSDSDWPSEYESDHLWFSEKGVSTKVLIVGDSHSRDLFNALYLNNRSFKQIEFARFGIDSSIPLDQIEKLKGSKNYANADIIIISFRYYNKHIKDLSEFLDDLIRSRKKILLTSNTVEFNNIKNEPIFDWYIKNHNDTFSLFDLKKHFYENRNTKRNMINNKIEIIAKNKNLIFLNKYDLICNDSQQTCDGITQDGFKSFSDYGHWTLEGAEYFGKKISEISWLRMPSQSNLAKN